MSRSTHRPIMTAPCSVERWLIWRAYRAREGDAGLELRAGNGELKLGHENDKRAIDVGANRKRALVLSVRSSVIHVRTTMQRA